MLSSFRISPINIPMPLVQLQHMYCTSVDEKQKILRTRAAQKQLYGEIIRKKSKDITIRPNANQISNASDSVFNEMKASAGSRASEFHWLIKRGKSTRSVIRMNVLQKSSDKDVSLNNEADNQSLPSQRVSANSKNQNELNTSTSDAATYPMQSSQTSTTMNAKGAIISAKELFQSFVTRKATDEQEIPFDMDELNSIVKYQLVSDKCSLSQTISLTDRSMKIPSISKILTATMPEGARIALRKWKMAKITELGPDGFKKYEKETLNLGKDFHSAIEQFLSNGEIPDSDSSVNQLWQSVNPSLNELKPKSVLMEQPILHADLKYKGIIDNVSLVK